MGWVSNFWMSDAHLWGVSIIGTLLLFVTIASIGMQLSRDFSGPPHRITARVLVLMPVVGPLLCIFWFTIVPCVVLFGLYKGGAVVVRRAEITTLFKTGAIR